MPYNGRFHSRRRWRNESPKPGIGEPAKRRRGKSGTKAGLLNRESTCARFALGLMKLDVPAAEIASGGIAVGQSQHEKVIWSGFTVVHHINLIGEPASDVDLAGAFDMA